MAIVTCHTEGCGNAGIGLDVPTTYADIDTGEERSVDSVSCGVCGQPITDVDPPLPGPERDDDGTGMPDAVTA